MTQRTQHPTHVQGAATPAHRHTPFLSFNFALQSTLSSPLSSEAQRRQARALAVWAALMLAAYGCARLAVLPQTATPALLGITFPGAGWLYWASGTQALLAAALSAASLCAFGAALVVWFATGNMIAPLATWLILAALACFPETVGLRDAASGGAWGWLPGPAVFAIGLALWLRGGRPAAPRPACSALRAPAAPHASAARTMSEADNARVQLLLDRALQPAEHFAGFEWRDQFQTAAVRYQVNFIAYALAMVRHHHAPAAAAPFAEAQARLLTKIGDHRLWRYWQLENAWGNLRPDADPVARENIMYAGFVLLQMALGGSGTSLDLARSGQPWRRYHMDGIAEGLARQYRTAPFGLLACEPNWIYPLCNLITMAGIKASDARLGTDRWGALADPFLTALAREGTQRGGGFIAFRSSLTGIAPPAPGGIVMQAFPCLFLNALAPDWAQAQWDRVRQRLDRGHWDRLFWPVDTGNYGFSRASGYAATAAAAAEMGDDAIAAACLARLESECPESVVAGVAHRARASLWAHALEVFARANGKDGLRGLVAATPRPAAPHLASAPYPAVQILRAENDAQGIDLVLLTRESGRDAEIAIGGLAPHRPYATGIAGQRFVTADAGGTIRLSLRRRGPITLLIRPAF